MTAVAEIRICQSSKNTPQKHVRWCVGLWHEPNAAVARRGRDAESEGRLARVRQGAQDDGTKTARWKLARPAVFHAEWPLVVGREAVPSDARCRRSRVTHTRRGVERRAGQARERERAVPDQIRTGRSATIGDGFAVDDVACQAGSCMHGPARQSRSEQALNVGAVKDGKGEPAQVTRTVADGRRIDEGRVRRVSKLMKTRNYVLM